jgi:hypothetical protein
MQYRLIAKGMSINVRQYKPVGTPKQLKLVLIFCSKDFNALPAALASLRLRDQNIAN